LERQGARKFVLDLRGNAGGAPEEGIELANLFLDRGQITSIQGQKTSKQSFDADPSKAVSKVPMVIVTNRGTACGAEIAAAALLDNKRAEVVGERTYGCGAVRKPLTLEDGSAVILAVAKYYSPSAKAIQDHGVTPSLMVAGSDQVPDTDDETPEQRPQTAPKTDEDLPLKKAIEVLKVGVTAARQNASRPVGTEAKGPAEGRENLLTPQGPLNVPRPPK
jgi:carboxyl-terminal processing protease